MCCCWPLSAGEHLHCLVVWTSRKGDLVIQTPSFTDWVLPALVEHRQWITSVADLVFFAIIYNLKPTIAVSLLQNILQFTNSKKARLHLLHMASVREREWYVLCVSMRVSLDEGYVSLKLKWLTGWWYCYWDVTWGKIFNANCFELDQRVFPQTVTQLWRPLEINRTVNFFF